jgi:7-cyano-7-deazaguanine synthase
LQRDKALVLFSGGQDSTTSLFWALENLARSKPENVLALAFNYGQKHRIELDSAQKIASMTGVKLKILDIQGLLESNSPLLDSNSKLEKNDSLDQFKAGPQMTFVAGRNILFLSLAANLAYEFKAQNIVTGVCETDFGGYFDCREAFIKSMQISLNQGIFGTAEGFQIHTPLMHLNKALTVKLAYDLDGCIEALAFSHTCYEGVFPPCGKCHACHLRARGFRDAGIEDPLISRAKSCQNFS